MSDAEKKDIWHRPEEAPEVNRSILIADDAGDYYTDLRVEGEPWPFRLTEGWCYLSEFRETIPEWLRLKQTMTDGGK